MSRPVKISEDVLGPLLNDAIDEANRSVHLLEEIQDIATALILKGQRPAFSMVNIPAFGAHFLPLFHNFVDRRDSNQAFKIRKARQDGRLSGCLFTTEDFQDVRCASYLLATMCFSIPSQLMGPLFVLDDKTRPLCLEIQEMISSEFISSLIGLSFKIRGKGDFHYSEEYNELQKFIVNRAWRGGLSDNEFMKLNSLVGDVAKRIRRK